MYKRLRDLATIKGKEKEPTVNDQVEKVDEESRKRTYHETGYRDSSRNSGMRIPLRVSLEAIYAKFQNEEKENVKKQVELNEPYKAEKAEKVTLLKTTQVIMDNLMDKHSAKKGVIDALKKEIVSIRSNPDEFVDETGKGTKVKFRIGILIIIPITLYLLTFYISTSYSAFFKKFEIGANVLESILDANAFTKSWADGALEGMFVTFIPFVFMGLGYLIHMFGEDKKIINSLKIFALIVVTFIFDAILAYLIEQELFNLEAKFDEEFNLSIAFQSVSFWGIIFAGFLVYIIWGLVFDFIMREHKKLDLITLAVKARRDKIKVEKENLEDIQRNIDNTKEQMEELKGRIEELNRLINSVIIPVKEYHLYATEYMQGWVTSISENYGASQKKKELIQDCYEEYITHIEEVGSNKEYQNIIFKN